MSVPDAVSVLIRSRRSMRDFLPRPIPQEVHDAVLESTVRYLGIEVDDTQKISEQTEI